MFQIFLNPAILEVMIVTLGSRALEYYNAKNEMRKRAELKQAGEAAEKERRRPTNPLLPLQSLLGGLGLTVGGEAQNANLNVQGVKLQLVKAQGVSVSCSEGGPLRRECRNCPGITLNVVVQHASVVNVTDIHHNEEVRQMTDNGKEVET